MPLLGILSYLILRDTLPGQQARVPVPLIGHQPTCFNPNVGLKNIDKRKRSLESLAFSWAGRHAQIKKSEDPDLVVDAELKIRRVAMEQFTFVVKPVDRLFRALDRLHIKNRPASSTKRRLPLALKLGQIAMRFIGNAILFR